MNKILAFSITVFCALSVSSCSTTTKAYLDSINLLLEDRSFSMSLEQTQASEIDVAKVQYGERPEAIIALAFIEQGTRKWVSSDHVIFTTTNDLLTTTSGLKNDLLYTQGLRAIPEANSSRVDLLSVDIDAFVYSHPVTARWSFRGQSELTVWDKSIPVSVFVEQVEFSDASPFVEVGLSWKNTYYVHTSSNTVLYTSQKLSPMHDEIELTYLSRAARILKGE